MFTKLTKWMMAIVLVGSMTAAPAVSAAGTKVKVKVTLVSVSLVDNNHVGNEWAYEGYVNGKALEEGSAVTLTVNKTDSIKLKGYAEEQDKVPDIGSKELDIKASAATQTLTKSLNVTVTENRGRYSGNTATWKFVFKLQKG